MALSRFFRRSKTIRQQKRSPRRDWQTRLARIEPLEQRNLLSLSITNLPSNNTVALDAGAPMMLALSGAGASNLTYSVSAASPDTTDLSATLMPSLTTQLASGQTANRSIQVGVSFTNVAGNVETGTMTFQLFDNLAPTLTNQIASLITTTSSSYDNLQIFRVDGDVEQAGSPTNDAKGSLLTNTYDDAYNPNLLFTNTGVLALAKAANDGNGSQFFITNQVERGWDSRYSIFGILTANDNIRQDIAALYANGLTTVNATTGLNQPNNPVTITSVRLVNDTQDGVLELSAPVSAAGKTETVNITISDGTAADTVTVPLTVNIAADTAVDEPFLQSVSDIHALAGWSATVPSLPAYVPNGSTPYFVYGSDIPSDGSLSFNSFSTATGQFQITPKSGFAGVSEVFVGVENASDQTNTPPTPDYDTQLVPVFVTPSAPTVTLLTPSKFGIVSVNTSLEFQVSGLFPVSGATVTLYADGKALETETVTGDTMTITTSSTTALADGLHTFIATQNISESDIDVGNRHDATNLTSGPSSAVNVTVKSITLSAGAPMMLALPGSSDKKLTYTVSAATPDAADLTATLMPSPTTQLASGQTANRSIQIGVSFTNVAGVTETGTMTFQLFDNLVPSLTSQIASLIKTSSSSYDGLQIFSVNGNVDQTGSPTNNGQGNLLPNTYDDAYNPNLLFSTSGLLALARGGNDSNGSQFYITNQAERGADFEFSIFGILTSGDNIRQDIAALYTNTQTQQNSTTGFSQPDNPVTITSVRFANDTQDAVLELSAPVQRRRQDGNRQRHRQRRHPGRHRHRAVDCEDRGRYDGRSAILEVNPGRPHARRPGGDGPQPAGLCSARQLGVLLLFYCRTARPQPDDQQLFQRHR